MRVLVTNDDGIAAPGIAPLIQAAVDMGYDVVAAAPMEDFSGAAAAIGPVHTGKGLRVQEVKLEGITGASCHGVDGPPALAVMLSRLGAFGDPPDLVRSGVNPGANTGRAVLHSGTVGAALTAANFGISGVAVSQLTGEPWMPEVGAQVGVAALEWARTAPQRTVLNVNVPNVSLAEIKGVREARLAPFGTVHAALGETGDGVVEVELRATEERLDDDTDTMIVQAGFVAVTSLVGIRAAGDAAAAVEALEAFTTSG